MTTDNYFWHKPGDLIRRFRGSVVRSNLAEIGGNTVDLVRQRAWECFKEDRLEYKNDTFEEFLRAKPFKGMNLDDKGIEALKALIEKTENVEAIAMFNEALAGKHGGAREGAGRPSNDDQEIKSNNVTLEKPDQFSPLRGNSKGYTSRRLMKDRPDLLKRVENKEMSLNAAAIEAGFRKPPPTSLDILKIAWRKCTDSERADFLNWMKKEQAA